MFWNRSVAVGLVVSALALGIKCTAADAPGRYVIYKADKPVLSIVDEPGPLSSSALPPPAGAPAPHTFLTATSMDPIEEDTLRRLLEASTNTADYLDRLKAAGYRVEQSKSAH